MREKQCFERSAGVLMHISSLPSPYGIGTFGKAAYEFVDMAERMGQKFWQVLPLGPTSYGDSPYQSFSAFAGNPYFIDLEMLMDDGFLAKEYVDGFDWGADATQVDYGILFQNRITVLKKAFEVYEGKITYFPTGFERMAAEFAEFKEQNADWLDDYALYMACKEHFAYQDWSLWEDDIRFRRPEAVERYDGELANEVEFWKFCQFEFRKQWNQLKSYANRKGIRMIGDIPIYVSMDSADVWANPQLFQLNEKLRPTKVAGVPPDAFSDLGQRWGNPLYDWEKMEEQDFDWWRRRMANQAELFDVIRIDHFLGIVKYYTIPAESPDARQGAYCVGPGRGLIQAIEAVVGDCRIIAEDLGVDMPEVKGILSDYNYPGMKVMEFAFGGDRQNPHLPHNYERNLIAYGGTHDNETLYGYYTQHSPEELSYAYAYLNSASPRQMVEETFRMAYASVANVVIFQMQDILGLGNEARMNQPSTLGNNWQWRLQSEQQYESEIAKLRQLVSIYGR